MVVKRKINVDRLTEDQLANAQTKISEKIAYESNELLNKWKSEFKTFGQSLEIAVEVGEEKDIELIKDDKNLSQFHCDPTLGTVAKELDRIACGMNQDLELAVTSCNKLLNRYGMSCNMAFVSKVISD